MLIISSLQNIKIKEVIKLRQRRDRDRTKKFIVEGYRELLRAVEAGLLIDTLFFCKEFFLGENEEALIRKIEKKGGEIIECTENVFGKLSYRDRPDGLLAVAPHLKNDLSLLENKRNPIFVVAESIEKPGNLGTILRSADAINADGVIICDRCTDIHNPNVVRASVGTLFTRPVVETTSEILLPWLRKEGISILAATPEANEKYTEANLSGAIAIVVGTEQYGLTDQWKAEANLQVSIPMNGVADSLNVAMATTLLLYEALRQRS